MDDGQSQTCPSLAADSWTDMAALPTTQAVLQSLVPALAYGARDSFAHVGTLRDVEERLARG